MPAVLAFIVTLAALQTAPAHDTPDLQGKLYKSVFVQGPGSLGAADLAKMPAAVSTRLERYLSRRAAFVSKLQGGASTLKDVAIEAKRRRLESGIVSLIEAPGIEELAAEYAASAIVLNEWQGEAAGPLSEAAHAEDFLKRNPSTPIAPYLYAFIALRARAADDPIFKMLADDIDRQPKIHATSAFHPRDFNPDT